MHHRKLLYIRRPSRRRLRLPLTLPRLHTSIAIKQRQRPRQAIHGLQPYKEMLQGHSPRRRPRRRRQQVPPPRHSHLRIRNSRAFSLNSNSSRLPHLDTTTPPLWARGKVASQDHGLNQQPRPQRPRRPAYKTQHHLRTRLQLPMVHQGHSILAGASSAVPRPLRSGAETSLGRLFVMPVVR